MRGNIVGALVGLGVIGALGLSACTTGSATDPAHQKGWVPPTFTAVDYPRLGRVLLDPEKAEADAPPRVPVYSGRWINGLRTDLPANTETWYVARSGDGWLVVYGVGDGENSWLARLDGEGQLVTSASERATGVEAFAIAGNANGSYVFINEDGHVEVDDRQGRPMKIFDDPAIDPYVAYGLADDGSLLYTEKGTLDTYRLLLDGTRKERPSDQHADSPDRRSHIAYESEDDCDRVVTDGQANWSLCDVRAVGWSPNSEVLVTTPDVQTDAYLFVPVESLYLQDRTTGAVIMILTVQLVGDSEIGETAWEDPGHLLVSVRTHLGGWSILRVAMDGTVTRADTDGLYRSLELTGPRFAVTPDVAENSS